MTRFVGTLRRADGLIVAFIGRIQPLKAPDVLLHAAAELRRTDPELAATVTTVIAGGPSGSGLDRPTALIDLAASLRLSDSVRFLPPLPRDRLADLYRACDVFVLPSVAEGFPLTVQEAMATGLPVVITDDPGYAPYGLDRELVGLVRPTSEQVRAALLRIAGDAELRARMGAYSADLAARRFSWAEHVRTLEAVYTEVSA